MKTLRGSDRSTTLAIILVGVMVLTIAVSITLVSLTYHQLVLDGRWAISSEWLKSADVEARAAALAQLAQSTRAIDLEAFVRINGILQTEPGIAARERLYELFYDEASKKPFARWTRADQRVAETVGRQFELVGLLIEGRLFDPDLFLRNWHRTVQKCWAACEAMVAERRVRQGDPGFWQRFEEINALAKDCEAAMAKNSTQVLRVRP